MNNNNLDWMIHCSASDPECKEAIKRATREECKEALKAIRGFPGHGMRRNMIAARLRQLDREKN